MDLREYYREIREIQRGFTEPFVVIVSEKTVDGGKPGMLREVSAETAAMLIQQRRARAATEEQADTFRLEALEAYEAAMKQQGPQVQVMVLAEQELRKFKAERNRTESEK
ncbi:MAG: hypothetical protein HY820_10965 [Acidobacteria bacterium]|nr:hypothetical protein [Acidobacteriota bacterium]